MSGTSESSEREPRDGPPSDPTRSLDVQSIGRVGAAAAWVAALGGGAGAYLLVSSGGRTGLTAGLLLGVVALAGLAVALQATGEPWPGEPGYGALEPGGGESEPGAGSGRYLPLADRLALGCLGGALGGIAVTAGVWVVAVAGIADLLGVQIAGELTATALGLRAGYGGLWGLVLALLYPRLPGRSALSRGTSFGLVPAAYALLVLYPLVLDLGWFGAELGVLTFVFVVLFHLLWGAVTGGLFRWAEVTDLGVLSRPLVGRRASDA